MIRLTICMFDQHIQWVQSVNSVINTGIDVFRNQTCSDMSGQNKFLTQHEKTSLGYVHKIHLFILQHVRISFAV